MSFMVIVSGSTKVVETTQIQHVRDSVTNAPDNAVFSNKFSKIVSIGLSGSGEDIKTFDLSDFGIVKGIALSSTFPINVQLLGGAAPALVDVTEMLICGSFTSLILTNTSLTDSPEVEVLVYGT